MRGRHRGLVALLALGVIVVLAWRFRPHQAPPPTPVPTSGVAPDAPRTAPAATPIRATVAASAPPAELDAEAVLRQLEPLSISDKPRALELALDADSKLPPDGVLAEARRALIVTLLVDVQRMTEARARARAFTAQYPSSRYLPLVQGVTGVHPRPRPSELRDARPPSR